MLLYAHYLIDLIITLVSCAAALILARWARSLKPAERRRARVLLACSAGIIVAGSVLGFSTVAVHFNHILVAWVRCAGLVIAGLMVYCFFLTLAVRRLKLFDGGRRRALRLAASAAIAAPAAAATFAFIRRDDLTFREVKVPVAGLPKDLDGLRIAQLTDIHLSPFLNEATLRRAVGMANETQPHITFVTGDLISTRGDPLDLCLTCLRDLRADAGLFGCLGNHERYALAEDYTQHQGARIGLRFLRLESVQLGFGDATLNLAGVDYQRKGIPYLVGADSLLNPGTFNLLLSHNPDVFPVAAQQGYDLTVAGHTHGGQVTLEMLHPGLNPARFSTPYIYGLYKRNGKQMYVSRGIGTIGIPARLGAPPEVVLLRLCAT